MWKAFWVWEDLDSIILSEFRVTGFREHRPNFAPPVTAEGIVATDTELQQSGMVLKMCLHLFCEGTGLPSGTINATAELPEQF